MEQTPMEIGARLAEKRKELGESLEDSARITRIRKTYLESLEADRYEELPGQAYVIGFLKVYARHLGLDAAPLIEALMSQARFETGDMATRAARLRPREEKVARAGGWGLFPGGLLAFLVAGALIYFAPEWYAGWRGEPENSSAQVSEPPASPPPPPVTSEPVAPPTEPAPALETSQPAAASVVPVADAAVEKQPVESETPEFAPLPPLGKDGGSLRMLAIADGTLMIQVDGYPARSYVLRDGLDLTWPVRREVTVEMAAPGQARFWLGGEELPLEGRSAFSLSPAKDL